jgi:hypothetical protein
MGSPPLNAFVVVVNQSGDAGTFQWVSADSAAGTEPIPACDEYRRTFDLEVSASQHLATTNVTINPNGLVEVGEERAPALPSTCPSPSGSAADSASVLGTPLPAEVDPDEIMVLFEGRETPDEHELSAWLNEWGLKETAVNRRTGWYRFRILDGSSVEEKVASSRVLTASSWHCPSRSAATEPLATIPALDPERAVSHVAALTG